MKVLLGTTNHANQPLVLLRGMRKAGLDCHHWYYNWLQNKITPVRYDGYSYDRIVDMPRFDWLGRQHLVVEEALEQGFDVFHLWNRSLIHNPGGIGFFTGSDLPILKAAGAKIVYRFTGYDLRLMDEDRRVNPHSPHHHGFKSIYDDASLRRYHDYLRNYVDEFVVTDPEMQHFIPEARIIPRALDDDIFKYVGVGRTSRPLVVHAPSHKGQKGTSMVLKALEDLRTEGLDFDVKLLHRVPHEEAVEWYRKADIVIDQILGGWYGVLSCEAMALGKPTIAYIRAGLEGHFDNELPLVNANPDTVTSALRSLIKDNEKRLELGEQARNYFDRTHRIESVAQAHIELYKEVSRRPFSASKVTSLQHPVQSAAVVELGLEYQIRSQKLTDAPSAAMAKARAFDDVKAQQRALRNRVQVLERKLTAMAPINATATKTGSIKRIKSLARSFLRRLR